MDYSKLWREEKQKRKERDKIIKQKNNDINDLVEKLNAMTQERDHWENKHKLLQKGALIYTTHEGYVNNAVIIPNDFESTYVQELPSNVLNGCYKVVEGNLELDKEKYRKLRGGL